MFYVRRDPAKKMLRWHELRANDLAACHSSLLKGMLIRVKQTASGLHAFAEGDGTKQLEVNSANVYELVQNRDRAEYRDGKWYAVASDRTFPATAVLQHGTVYELIREPDTGDDGEAYVYDNKAGELVPVGAVTCCRGISLQTAIENKMRLRKLESGDVLYLKD